MEPEHVVLRTPAQFKALGHPMRHRLVNLLRQRPATLGELAAALGATKGTVGYHVRVLRDAGLVRLATTRQVRGGTQQYFALVSVAIRFHEDAAVGGEFLVQAALDEMLPGPQGHTELRHLWLTEDQVEALAGRLAEFAAAQPQAIPPGSDPHGLLLSLYRADIPTLSPGDDEPS